IHFAAERREDRCVFASDDSGADYSHRLRDFLDEQDLVAVANLFVIERNVGRTDRGRSSGDENDVAFEDLAAEGGFDLDVMRRLKTRRAFEQIDLMAPDVVVDAPPFTLDHDLLAV